MLWQISRSRRNFNIFLSDFPPLLCVCARACVCVCNPSRGACISPVSLRHANPQREIFQIPSDPTESRFFSQCRYNFVRAAVHHHTSLFPYCEPQIWAKTSYLLRIPPTPGVPANAYGTLNRVAHMHWPVKVFLKPGGLKLVYCMFIS